MAAVELLPLQAALNLTTPQARIVAALSMHAGWMTVAHLQDQIGPHSSGRRIAISSMIDAIRAKTREPFFILGHEDHGYTLGAPGVSTVRSVLGEL